MRTTHDVNVLMNWVMKAVKCDRCETEFAVYAIVEGGNHKEAWNQCVSYCYSCGHKLEAL